MPREIDSVAQVYGRSLFELAQEAGGRDKIIEVGDELEQICEAARGNRVFAEFLRSPIIDTRARMTSLSRIFSDAITDLTLRFLLVLNDKGRLGHLERITAAYDHLVQEAFGRVEVDVYTPAPLSAEQVERLEGRIQAALRKEPVLHRYTDPSMLGGIRLRIGDQLVDASVATQLRRMRDHLLGSGGAALRERLPDLLEEGESRS